MPRTPQDVTEAELNVLRALWDSEPATIRRLTDAVYPGGDAAAYATVQKLLDRLETKGFVSRDRRGHIHAFRSRVGRDDLIGRRLRSLADQLCEGSVAPLLSHLVTTERLTPAERASLRTLIDELDSKTKRSDR